jgi:hypothetical protein
MQMKCLKRTIGDFRTYLGHAEVVAVDFAIRLWAKQRFFISTWLIFSAPKVTMAANTGLCQPPMMQMKCLKRTIDDLRTYLGHAEVVAVGFAIRLWAKQRFFIRTLLISAAPKVPMAANTGLCQSPMMQMKSPGHTIDDLRACLGHAEVVAVDFAIRLWAKQRFFIRTWLTSSAPEVTMAANTGLRQVPMMQMKCR